MNWLEYLGWTTTQLEDLRSVGYSYVKQGKYDIALSFFEALVILSNDDSYDLQMLGAIYLQKGKNLEALDYLDHSLKKSPNHYPAVLNKIKALFALGYKKQAMTLSKQLLSCPDKTIQEKAEAILLSHP